MHTTGEPLSYPQGRLAPSVLRFRYMQRRDIAFIEAAETTARRDGIVDFKDEDENEGGLPFDEFTLRSTTEPAYPDGRWVTKRHALKMAANRGVELFEY